MQEEPWKPSDKPQGQIRIEDTVRPWVEGMTALVVSNRMDPDLEKRLGEKLGLDITWAICDMRRAQAQAHAIARNKYDIVIGQTGFISHNVEEILSRACGANNIPYIRAEKARPTATAMALIRDLGIDITKEPPVDTTRVMEEVKHEPESQAVRIRRRNIIVPQEPKDYKDLDIDILKFLERNDTYFRLEEVFQALPGVPIVYSADGTVNWNQMRLWMNAVGQILRKLNYVNTQLPQSIDQSRPRVWIRRDRQTKLSHEAIGNVEQNYERTPAEVARSQPSPQARQQAWPSSSKNTRQNNVDQVWLLKHEKAVRAYAKDKLYVHPEDTLRLLEVKLPSSSEIIWPSYMYWTKRIALILRKMGFSSRQREFDGKKLRVWIHKKSPRFMPISPPGQGYVAPHLYKSRPRGRQPAPLRPVAPQPVPSRPVAKAPSPASLPRVAAAGSKSVRISFSSISGGSSDDLLLALTQAGWAVSFGP